MNVLNYQAKCADAKWTLRSGVAQGFPHINSEPDWVTQTSGSSDSLAWGVTVLSSSRAPFSFPSRLQRRLDTELELLSMEELGNTRASTGALWPGKIVWVA